MHLDHPTIRSKIPSLKFPAVIIDNPGGTQVVQPVDNFHAVSPELH